MTMIKSCEDVKTLNDFYKFSKSWHNAREMGLKETVVMMRWSKIHLICPTLFATLTSYE